MCDGEVEGRALNVNVGGTEGKVLGSDEATRVGTCVGCSDGNVEGRKLGGIEGVWLGSDDGNGLGS